MRKIFTYRLICFAIVCIFMLQSQVSVAQWTLDVMGTVKKEENKKRMEGATITIKRNGSVWKTVTSPANGKFQLRLLPNAVYVIEFSKPGHVTKRIEMSTRNVPPDDAKYGFDFPMEMVLFEEMDGLDVSILNKPIAKVAFNPETGYMDYDPAYTKSIKKELDRLKKELAERLKAEEANRKANQKDYDAAIAAADKAYNAEKWAEAKPFYEKALNIFPKETYPDFQLGDISDKLAGLEAANKKYNAAIERADKAFTERDWVKATTNYENALALKDQEQYPKDKIKEIKDIQSNEKKVTKEYNEAIALADQYLLNKKYEDSKTEYQKASMLKSYEEYPKDKIKEIDTLLAELAKKDKDYNDLIAQADSDFGAKEYQKSIDTYSKALDFKPEEQYPKGKIDEAKRLMIELKRIEEDYNNFITAADASFTSKDYKNAQLNYEGASKLKGEEQYPKDKLLEIISILEAANKLEDEYANYIKTGDKAISSKDYEGAKSAFESALALKDQEQYPKDKLSEIEGLLASLAKQKELDEQYQKLITSADKLLEDKNYEVAKGKYTEALGIKSEEQYPKDKLTEIEGLLAG
ncbi:MAG: carboxypeptidase regulatory-like domain-containing protein [Flavobacteriales bacterium]|nr:carboxypeptidase regulatory-like domain-containing protein [Flavobacteriales bacterium]